MKISTPARFKDFCRRNHILTKSTKIKVEHLDHPPAFARKRLSFCESAAKMTDSETLPIYILTGKTFVHPTGGLEKPLPGTTVCLHPDPAEPRIRFTITKGGLIKRGLGFFFANPIHICFEKPHPYFFSTHFFFSPHPHSRQHFRRYQQWLVSGTRGKSQGWNAFVSGIARIPFIYTG